MINRRSAELRVAWDADTIARLKAERECLAAALAAAEANRVRLRVALIILRNQVLDEVQPSYSDDGDDAWSIVLREVRGALDKQQVGEWAGTLAAAQAALAAAEAERARYKAALEQIEDYDSVKLYQEGRWADFDEYALNIVNDALYADAAALAPPPPAGEATPKNLPSTDDLRGSDPDFTGGLTTEEYIRHMRGDPAPPPAGEAT